jgi:penicillin-binding protein 2
MRFRFRSRRRKDSYNTLSSERAPLYYFQQRLWTAVACIVLAFLILFGRFFYLQFFSFERFQTQAENNRIAVIPVVPTRGTISDRNGTILAHNYSTYTLEITPDHVGDLEGTLKQLSEIIDISPRDLVRFRRALNESRNYTSLPLRTRLTDEEVARFAVYKYRFPGVDIQARLFRQYPYQETASHVIGYINRINAQDVEKLKENGDFANYRGTQHIGKIGIEAAYEPLLHGIVGFEQVEVDALGRRVRSLSIIPPTAGDSIELTIDLTLQQIAEYALGEHNGAIVAINPTNGEVLAMVSNPGFDPSLFVEGIDTANWSALNQSPDKPLLNRARQGLYPPGSTIKPYLALSALQNGKRRPQDTIYDPGQYQLPGTTFVFRDQKKGGHGRVDMKESIVQSCDTYYYILAAETDIDVTAHFLEPFGFGQLTGIDIDGEFRGVLPSREWKRNRYKGSRYREDHRRWYQGDSVSAGIGQGYNSFTPIQLATAVATLANDGNMFRPHLLRRVINNATGLRQTVQPEFIRNIPIKPENLKVIQDAMVDVNKYGTAWRSFRNTPYTSAGKTGTAQVFSLKRDEKYEDSKAKTNKYLRDHALFIAYAPAENPSIAIAIIAENAGFGASTSAPIARKMLDYWLSYRPGAPYPYPEKKK